MLSEIEIKVLGTPVPQGSMVATKTGKLYHQNSAKLKSWRLDIMQSFASELPSDWDKNGAVQVNCDFVFDRPKNHMGAKGVRPSAPMCKMTKPDIDKLLRAVLDALTGVVMLDDSQVVYVSSTKRFCSSQETPFTTITVRSLYGLGANSS